MITDRTCVIVLVQEGVKQNYAYFPVIFNEKEFGASRNEVFEKLAENGIGARKYFYPLTNTYDYYHGRYDVNLTPVALHISKRGDTSDVCRFLGGGCGLHLWDNTGMQMQPLKSFIITGNHINKVC